MKLVSYNKIIRNIIAAEILEALSNGDCPDEFYREDMEIKFNSRSGCVYLVNCDYQVAMMNDGKLEMFYTLGYSGDEGFVDDLKELYDNGDICDEDLEELYDIFDRNSVDYVKEDEEMQSCRYCLSDYKRLDVEDTLELVKEVLPNSFENTKKFNQLVINLSIVLDDYSDKLCRNCFEIALKELICVVDFDKETVEDIEETFINKINDMV